MSAGNHIQRTKAMLGGLPHLLHIKDEDTFVAFEDLPGNPFGEVSERMVESTTHVMRPCFCVRDSKNRNFLLAFYLNRGSAEEKEAYKFKPGMTVCLERAFQHNFMDGQRGVRVEDDEWTSVRYLPCSMGKLAEISEELKTKPETCASCKKAKPASRCSRCSALYCNAECQRSDWTGHKTVCKAREQLQALNEEYLMEMMDDDEPGYDQYGLSGSDSDSDGRYSGGHLSEGEGDVPPDSDEES